MATIVETQDEIETARERSRRRHQEDQRRRQRRRLLLLAAGVGGSLAFIVGAVVAGLGGGSDQPAGAEAKPVPVPELPGGGRRILPSRRVVAFYGTVNSPLLGTLGRGTPAQAAARLKKVSRAYAGAGRPKVLPAFEVISTVASSAPGEGVALPRPQAAGADRALPPRDPQGGRDPHHRHPAGPLGLLHRGPALQEAPAGTRRLARARPRVEDGPGPDPRAGDRPHRRTARSTPSPPGCPSSSRPTTCPRSCSSSTSSPTG